MTLTSTMANSKKFLIAAAIALSAASYSTASHAVCSIKVHITNESSTEVRYRGMWHQKQGKSKWVRRDTSAMDRSIDAGKTQSFIHEFVSRKPKTQIKLKIQYQFKEDKKWGDLQTKEGSYNECADGHWFNVG